MIKIIEHVYMYVHRKMFAPQKWSASEISTCETLIQKYFTVLFLYYCTLVCGNTSTCIAVFSFMAIPVHLLLYCGSYFTYLCNTCISVTLSDL